MAAPIANRLCWSAFWKSSCTGFFHTKKTKDTKKFVLRPLTCGGKSLFDPHQYRSRKPRASELPTVRFALNLKSSIHAPPAVESMLAETRPAQVYAVRF